LVAWPPSRNYVRASYPFTSGETPRAQPGDLCQACKPLTPWRVADAKSWTGAAGLHCVRAFAATTVAVLSRSRGVTVGSTMDSPYCLRWSVYAHSHSEVGGALR